MTEFLSRELAPYTVAAIIELLALFATFAITCGSLIVILDEAVTSTLYPQKAKKKNNK